MTSPVVVLAALALVYFLYRLLTQTDTPRIKNLPEIPGVPIFGNLLQLGDSHAKVARQWADRYGPVFQTRLGNRRVVFANSFDSVKHLWTTHQSSLISRPKLHTFHTVVSSSEGFTIGTSPWDESCKARRKAAATALNKPAVQSYMPVIDYESTRSIKELMLDSDHGKQDVDPNQYFARYALSTSLNLNYGIKIEGNIDDKMLREIVHIEREIGNFRSTSHNWQDYIPLLRLWPSSSTYALEIKERRAAYMNKMLRMLKDRIAAGIDKPCITGNILKDPDAILNDAEIMSICLTMVSAGLDTVPGNLSMGLAYLASPQGQAIQSRALSEINSTYPENDAWERCLHEEKVPYISALVKEVLRFWTVIPINLPRVSIRDIPWENAIIPAGTTFYMNTYAANYDAQHFKEPFDFNPDRFLADDTTGGTPHYSFGAGTRMCAGSHLASRELYTAFIRIITAFEVCPPERREDEAILDVLEANNLPTSLTMDPKPFKVGIKVRDQALLDRWIAESEVRTKDL
ncbi:hypothetical protein ANO11243_004970 [Dothideomycetidae sp. 11243]|nr:hypothetical protein ANO11243_004970 [fungal sp. No.11243]